MGKKYKKNFAITIFNTITVMCIPIKYRISLLGALTGSLTITKSKNQISLF